ncbi:sigma-70 family RNA polymerase sigma factor [Aquisphaera insulae]|uniref:sigma-70 family RNA polymerase sigma factor n=1 Tax=Aquisphaera insulae TaxID=2712864 RepID=UPI0013E9E9CE|nr:sigma-70 family RNA polymerase sigma factor [Aquisphaera insulae]
MKAGEVDTEELLRRAAGGDATAGGSLLERHRASLRRIVARRLDRRIVARVDPSDVVQEAMSIAIAELPRFARERPVSFACWLRRQAIVRLGWLHRFHLRTGMRSVAREVSCDRGGRSEEAAAMDNLVDPGTGPSTAATRAERAEHVRSLLDAMAPADREILVLRYASRLSLDEIAERLEISPGAVKMRYARAMERLRALVRGSTGGSRP